MAILAIKPASGTDDFQFQDSSGNAILQVDGDGSRVDYKKGISENANTLTQSSATITIDLATGTFFEFTLTENVTGWTFSNVPTTGTACSWVVKITQHASSAKTVVYPAGVKWAGGTDHEMSTAVDAIDIISMFTIDGGTTIFANEVGKAFA
tara:strand:- start:1865 stop:2320 length:456 start_codon:yes stop_codon:yes gene_type:complete